MAKRIRSQSPASPACHASKTKRAAPHFTSLHLTSLLSVLRCTSASALIQNRSITCCCSDMTIAILRRRLHGCVSVCESRILGRRVRVPGGRLHVYYSSQLLVFTYVLLFAGPMLRFSHDKPTSRFHERDLPLDTMRPSMPYACSAHCKTIQWLRISLTWHAIDVVLVTTFSADINSA
jgi:hypothetical protein